MSSKINTSKTKQSKRSVRNKSAPSIKLNTMRNPSISRRKKNKSKKSKSTRRKRVVRNNPVNYRLYVVTHGESSTVQESKLDFGESGKDNKPNTLTIGELKKYIGGMGNITIYRAAQPGAVFMSNVDSNEDLRDNYVGTKYFPNFARRIPRLRGVNKTVVTKDVEGKGGENKVASSEQVLLNTLQMFTHTTSDDDEIYNERLLSDLGFEAEKHLKKTDVFDASEEFGVWLRVSGAEDDIGVWPKNQQLGNPGEFYKIMGNDHRILMNDSGSEPKNIRIADFLKEVVKLLKTNGVKEAFTKKDKRFKTHKIKEKWPRLNEKIDTIELFFANCSPAIIHPTRRRLMLQNPKIYRLRKDTCNNYIKWFNLFCLACKRIKIFQKGKKNIENYMKKNEVIFTPNDIEEMAYLDEIDTPWSIIDKEERAELYKNFICFLMNIKKWKKNMPELHDTNIANLAYMINNITTPLHLGGTGQLTDRFEDTDKTKGSVGKKRYDTIVDFVKKKLDVYIKNKESDKHYQQLIDALWDGKSEIKNYVLQEYETTNQSQGERKISTMAKNTPEKILQSLGGKKNSSKRLKQKIICHKGTKKQLKKLKKVTKKLKLRLTKCSRERLKNRNMIQKKHKRRKK